MLSLQVPGIALPGEVDKMKHYGTFVEQWVIEATAQMVGHDIIIANSVEGRKAYTKIDSESSAPDREPLLIGHLTDGVHYLSLGMYFSFLNKAFLKHQVRN